MAQRSLTATNLDAGEYWKLYLSQFCAENDGGVYSASELSRFMLAARRNGVRIDAEDVREMVESSGHCKAMHPNDASLFEENLLAEVDAINATLDILETDFGLDISTMTPRRNGSFR